MRISNVIGDVDNETTWFPAHDGELKRDPSRVYAGVKLRYSGGSVYRTRPETAHKFGWRDMLVDAPHITSEAVAIARADRYLLQASTEDDRLSWTVTLPAAHVNDAREGEILEVRFSHLPDYGDDFRKVRALSRTVSQSRMTPFEYDVHYEATPLEPLPGIPQGAFAHQATGISGSGIPILPHNTTPGNVLLLFVTAGSTASQTTLGAARCADDPDLASPPIPPYPDQAGWTVLGTAETNACGQNILGPGCPGGFAQSATILWRYVQPGEVTDHPVAFSSPNSPGGAGGWLYELPTTVPPVAGGTFATPNPPPPNVPADYSLPSTSGNAVGVLLWEFADTGDEAAYLTEVSGTTITNAQGNNDPNNAVIGTGWAAGWTWIGQLSAGGVMTVNMDTIPAYDNLAACGVTATIPAGITLPTIPYPANQV